MGARKVHDSLRSLIVRMHSDGYTQEQIATELKLSQATVSRVLNDLNIIQISGYPNNPLGGAEIVRASVVNVQDVCAPTLVKIKRRITEAQKKSGTKPTTEYTIPPAYMAYYALSSEMPEYIFGIPKSTIKDVTFENHLPLQVVTLSGGARVVNFGDAVSVGTTVEAVIEKYNTAIMGSAFKDPCIRVAKFTVVEKTPEEKNQERMKKDYGVENLDIDELSDEELERIRRDIMDKGIDYEKAFDGIAVGYVGDRDAKEILTYAYCVYDPTKPQETKVSLLLAADAGLGKSVFLDGLHKSIDARKAFAGDDITPAAAGTATSEGKVRTMGFGGSILLFDEIDKYSAKNLETLLGYFETQRRHRIRYMVEFEKDTDAWAIGTILTAENKLEKLSEKGAQGIKKSSLRQVMRRCVILHLSAQQQEDQEAYSNRVLDEEIQELGESMTPEDEERVYELLKLKTLAHLMRRQMALRNETFSLSKRNREQIAELAQEVCPLFWLGEGTNWGRSIERLIIRLAKGRALSQGRTELTIDDVERIVTILLKFAKELDYVKTTDDKSKERMDYWTGRKILPQSPLRPAGYDERFDGDRGGVSDKGESEDETQEAGEPAPEHGDECNEREEREPFSLACSGEVAALSNPTSSDDAPRRRLPSDSAGSPQNTPTARTTDAADAAAPAAFDLDSARWTDGVCEICGLDRLVTEVRAETDDARSENGAVLMCRKCIKQIYPQGDKNGVEANG